MVEVPEYVLHQRELGEVARLSTLIDALPAFQKFGEDLGKSITELGGMFGHWFDSLPEELKAEITEEAVARNP